MNENSWIDRQIFLHRVEIILIKSLLWLYPVTLVPVTTDAIMMPVLENTSAASDMSRASEAELNTSLINSVPVSMKL